MQSKSSKWELSFVRYITKFTKSRFTKLRLFKNFKNVDFFFRFYLYVLNGSADCSSRHLLRGGISNKTVVRKLSRVFREKKRELNKNTHSTEIIIGLFYILY